MPDKSTKFLIDTNLFVAAVKSRKTKSTELLLMLIDGTWDLVADDILISEYERYSHKFEAYAFFDVLQRKVIMIEQSEEDILKCKPYFSPNSSADIVHAAACLHTGAVLITNDAHFDRIRDAGVIVVWSISEAIMRVINKCQL